MRTTLILLLLLLIGSCRNGQRCGEVVDVQEEVFHSRGRVTLRLNDSTLVVCHCNLTDLKNMRASDRLCLPHCQDGQLIRMPR